MDFDERLRAYEDIFIKFNKIHSLSTYKNLDEVAKDSLGILEFSNFLAQRWLLI